MNHTKAQAKAWQRAHDRYLEKTARDGKNTAADYARAAKAGDAAAFKSSRKKQVHRFGKRVV